MTRYTSSAQAAADAGSIGPAPPGLAFLWAHIRAVLADPRADSDHLLIMADALRADATIFLGTDPAAPMIRLAHLLADLAPSRANPIEDVH